MGINYNPRGVSEGLIYYIDPNNVKSFSGTGNTVYNLVNASIGGTFVGSTAAPIDSTSTRTFYMGGSNYINCPNNIPLTNNFTVSVWFKLNAYNNSAVINKWYADGSNNNRCWFIGSETSSSSVVVVVSSDGTYTNPTIKRYNVAVSLNEYTNITFTFATGTLTVYKNGILATVTKTLDASFSTVYDNPARSIQIGYGYDGGNNYGLNNVGITQIYNRVLSPTEILQNYDATKKRYYPEENIVRDGLILNLDPGNSRSYAGAGNTIYDLAGFGNTGTLTNGPTFSTTNNGSIFFDGSNDYTYVNHNSSQNLTFITISAWFNFPTVPFSGIGINKESAFRLMAGESYTSNASGRLGGSWATGVGPGSTTLRPNRWYQIVMTADGTTQKLYVDGLLDYSSNNTALASVNSNVLSFATYHFGAGAFMNCRMSQALIYNRALSAQEIQQNYNATKNRFINTVPPVRDNLILNLDAGDLASYPGSGTTWFDLSGNSLNGTLTNGPTFSFSDSSSSILFDGVNDYVSQASGNYPISNSLTISAWIKHNSLVGNQRYISFTGAYETAVIRLNNTQFSFYISTNGTLKFLSGSSSPSTNVWHYVVGTWDGTTQRLYQNGIQINSSTPGGLLDAGNLTYTLSLSNESMKGNMSIVQIYNRALSAAEIAQNFNYYRSRYGI